MWGVSNEFLVIKGRSVINGRSFTDDDINSFSKVVIIGLTVKEMLFGGQGSNRRDRYFLMVYRFR